MRSVAKHPGLRQSVLAVVRYGLVGIHGTQNQRRSHGSVHIRVLIYPGTTPQLGRLVLVSRRLGRESRNS